jgi:hypothetical protein
VEFALDQGSFGDDIPVLMRFLEGYQTHTCHPNMKGQKRDDFWCHNAIDRVIQRLGEYLWYLKGSVSSSPFRDL